MNEKIDAIILCMNNRKMIGAKRLLKDLEIDLNKLENLQKFFNKIDKICRELGKTNMIHKEEIEELLKEHRNKKEVKKMKEQKITFELDKELDKESNDKIVGILKDLGAENIKTSFEEEKKEE